MLLGMVQDMPVGESMFEELTCSSAFKHLRGWRMAQRLCTLPQSAFYQGLVLSCIRATDSLLMHWHCWGRLRVCLCSVLGALHRRLQCSLPSELPHIVFSKLYCLPAFTLNTRPSGYDTTACSNLLHV